MQGVRPLLRQGPYWINKGYAIRYWVCNTSPFEVEVTLPPTMEGSIGGDDVVFDVGIMGEETSNTFLLPAGSTDAPSCVYIDLKCEYNTSGNTPVWANGTATWQGTGENSDITGTSDISFYAEETPLCEYPSSGHSPNGCTFPPDDEPSALLLTGGKLPTDRSCTYYDAENATTFFAVNVRLTNTDLTRGIHLITSSIEYELDPFPGTVQYVGPLTPIYLGPGATGDYWFGAVATKPYTDPFTADASICIDWEFTSGFTPPHEPICSPTVSVTFDDNANLCALLFGSDA